MKRIRDFFERGNIAGITMVASALVALLALVGSELTTIRPGYDAHMYLTPQSGAYRVGDTFVIDIIVEASVPTNVFAGELRFDPERLMIDAIDYNTSIADLWAERPWYENGDGTLTFGGGTTKPGGFTGSGELISVTFKAKVNGTGALSLTNARILQHNGLGTSAQVQPSIDTIITIADTPTLAQDPALREARYILVDEFLPTDLNRDGKQTIADVSIFMRFMAQGDLRSDFDGDGNVGTKDLARILGAK